MLRSAFARFLCVVAVGATAVACGNDASEDEALDNDAKFAKTLSELEAQCKKLGIPGMSVAIVLDGKLAYSGGVGVRSKASGEPMTAKTLVLSSSVATKPLIAATLLDLAEEGQVDFDEPVQTYAPFIVTETDPKQVTLRSALTQRSGLAEPYPRPGCSADEASMAHFFEAKTPIQTLATAGSVFVYTAVGSMIGAGVIEAVENRPFDEVVSERALEPLGMATATFDFNAAMATDHATSHMRTAHGSLQERELDQVPQRTCDEWRASEGLMASAEDIGHAMERWVTGTGPLDPKSMKELCGRLTTTGRGEDWAFGYQMFNMRYKDLEVVSRGANAWGSHGVMMFIPERQFGVVLLGSSSGSTEAFAATDLMRYRIADRFLDLTGDPPNETTAPSTWSKYVGHYRDPRRSFFDFEVSQTASGALVAKALSPGDAMPLHQGFSGQAYTGGDTFEYIAPDGQQFAAAFFPDESGAPFYMAGVWSVADFVAERVE